MYGGAASVGLVMEELNGRKMYDERCKTYEVRCPTVLGDRSVVFTW